MLQRLRPVIERLLKPSFSDFIFVAILGWMFVLAPDGFSTLLEDGDTGWHIRAGEYILDHGAVPLHDLFSYSKAGEPWYAWEWGTDVIYALLFRAAGLKAITLFAGAEIALFAALLIRFTVARGASPLFGLATTFIAVAACNVHYFARPHLATLLLVPVCAWILDRNVTKPDWVLWLLVPITAAWTNLHGGFLAAIALVGIYFAGSVIETLWDGTASWSASKRLAIAGVLCCAATFVNPYGYQLHVHLAEYLNSDWIRNAVSEFQSPSFRAEHIRQYEMLLVAGLMAASLSLARRSVSPALLLLFWAHQSLTSVRHLTIYVSLAAPLIALEATVLWRRFADGAPRKSTRAILDQMAADALPNFRHTSLWPAAALAVLAFVPLSHVHWPSDFPAYRFPTKMVAKHEAELKRATRLLTSDQWADYLIFRNYPSQRVYFDGRSDFYGEKLGQEFAGLIQGRYDWREILDRRDFDVAFIPLDWPLASLMKRDANWRLVDDDGATLLFERIAGAERLAQR